MLPSPIRHSETKYERWRSSRYLPSPTPWQPQIGRERCQSLPGSSRAIMQHVALWPQQTRRAGAAL